MSITAPLYLPEFKQLAALSSAQEIPREPLYNLLLGESLTGFLSQSLALLYASVVSLMVGSITCMAY